MDAEVTCPHCQNDFPIDQIISAKMSASIRGEMEAEFSKKAFKLTEERDRIVAERAEIDALKEKLEHSQENCDKEIRNRVASECRKIEVAALAAAQENVAVELQDKEERIAESAAKLKAMQEQELQLRKEKRKSEELAEQSKLEMERRLDEERKVIRANAKSEAAEENQLKLIERDLQIESMKKQIDELVKKADQGSQQRQGEAQEIALENMLAAEFPCDVIEPVGKGVNGADALHHVFDNNGRECGTILWESKRTKTWQDKWLGKVISDQQEAKASVACIVSGAMPATVRHFEEINGVWVSSWPCARGMALVLRRVLVESSRARQASEGQHGKMELVYNYIFSPEFRNRVRGFMEPFLEMQTDLNAEKRALNRQWNKRQKQLDRALASSAGLFGDFQGILGNDLKEIEGMDLLALEEESEVQN